ncbi:unnamed protein product, partial [Adineta steineri]
MKECEIVTIVNRRFIKFSTSIHYNNTINISDSLVYRVATEIDSDSLATLINNAYRSPIADQGRTNENTLVLVPRANAKSLSNMIKI